MKQPNKGFSDYKRPIAATWIIEEIRKDKAKK